MNLLFFSLQATKHQCMWLLQPITGSYYEILAHPTSHHTFEGKSLYQLHVWRNARHFAPAISPPFLNLQIASLQFLLGMPKTLILHPNPKGLNLQF